MVTPSSPARSPASRSARRSAASDYPRADAAGKPEAGVEDVALNVASGQVHEVYLQRGVDGVGQVRLQQQLLNG
jgi:hypothetical protein